jgi:hypothetical protein
MERRLAYGTLAAGLAALYGFVILLVARGVVARAPSVIGAAATFDLTVTAALGTWWLGARRGRVHRRAPLAVMALGFVVARALLPPEAREGLWLMRALWVAAELALIVVVLRRAGAAQSLPARMVASELRVMRFALAGWFQKTPAEDERTFSMHRRSHFGVLVGVFIFLMAGEGTALHVLLLRWSQAAAWISSGSTLWLALWLCGDAQALRLQPLRIGDDALEVLVGIRWRTRIPWSAVREVGLADGSPAGPGTLKATAAGAADVKLRLHHPLEAHGLFGRVRQFDALLLSVDRPAEFVAAARGRTL